MKIGVIALQGAFIEHIKILSDLGVEAVQIRLPTQLDSLDGLIIPGGESTTMVKLADAFKLMEPLRLFGLERAIWGTCAGAILMAGTLDRPQPTLGLMDIAIRRNAFGRQVDSFEMDLDAAFLDEQGTKPKPFHAVFIRAPLIERVYGAAQPLVTLPGGQIVAAQQARLMATSFHPELTGDTRFHQYFLTRIVSQAATGEADPLYA